jgi:hypothetical protein
MQMRFVAGHFRRHYQSREASRISLLTTLPIPNDPHLFEITLASGPLLYVLDEQSLLSRCVFAPVDHVNNGLQRCFGELEFYRLDIEFVLRHVPTS